VRQSYKNSTAIAVVSYVRCESLREQPVRVEKRVPLSNPLPFTSRVRGAGRGGERCLHIISTAGLTFDRFTPDLPTSRQCIIGISWQRVCAAPNQISTPNQRHVYCPTDRFVTAQSGQLKICMEVEFGVRMLCDRAPFTSDLDNHTERLTPAEPRHKELGRDQSTQV
jgi:hypothetical protein